MQLKDYTVYRVDERDCHYELAGESELECEAIRFANLMIETEPEELDGIHYEVRLTATAEPIHRTQLNTRQPAAAALA